MNSSTGDRNLGGTFRQLFKLEPALDQEGKDTVYRVRHDVYCRDLGWEPVREDGMESDEFDRHSVHCLLRRRESGEPVGCTRLILARPEEPSFPLPFEKSCRDVFDRSIVDPATLPRQRMGEVSRLAVVNTFRQRKGEAGTAVSVSDEDFESRGGMPRFPFIPVSLYLGMACIALKLGVEHVFVLTEPRLASHFVRIGFDIHQIGGGIEHRGTRVPSMLSSSKTVAGLRPLIRPLYAVIEEEIDLAFKAHPEMANRLR